MPVRSERLFDRARLGTMELELLKICLDFANTADWHTSDQPRETLKDYFGLVSWAVRTGILDDDTAAELSDKAARQPEGAQRTYRRAIDLREAIFRVFSSVARDDRPEESDLSALNAALPEAMAHLRLVRNEGRFEWDWIEDAASFDRVLWPVVRSAALLLTSETLPRVGMCANSDCGWLFIDMSRNKSRRWCDMKDCGNRAKAKRFYRKKKAEEKTKR